MKMQNTKVYAKSIKNWIILGLILVYLAGFALMYLATVVELKGNIKGLRAEHLDIPSFASDTVYQIKNIACLIVGLLMLSGFAGLLVRQNWGMAMAVAGLFSQSLMYIVEMAVFRSQFFNYPPTKAIVGIILINVLIIWYLVRTKTK